VGLDASLKHALHQVLLLVDLTSIHHSDFFIPLRDLSFLLLLSVLVHLFLDNFLFVLLLLLPQIFLDEFVNALLENTVLLFFVLIGAIWVSKLLLHLKLHLLIEKLSFFATVMFLDVQIMLAL
jgi:hypothetical protein